MADAVFLAVVFAFVGFAATLVLYQFVRDETRQRTEMTRADAEAYARDRASDRYGGDGDGSYEDTRQRR